MTLLQRIRLALWKLRYGLRVYQRSAAPDMKFGYYLPWCLGECANVGWDWVLDCASKNVEAALKESPVESADEELSNWDAA